MFLFVVSSESFDDPLQVLSLFTKRAKSTTTHVVLGTENGK